MVIFQIDWVLRVIYHNNYERPPDVRKSKYSWTLLHPAFANTLPEWVHAPPPKKKKKKKKKKKQKKKKKKKKKNKKKQQQQTNKTKRKNQTQIHTKKLLRILFSWTVQVYNVITCCRLDRLTDRLSSVIVLPTNRSCWSRCCHILYPQSTPRVLVFLLSKFTFAVKFNLLF